jgi:hypothetical protein
VISQVQCTVFILLQASVSPNAVRRVARVAMHTDLLRKCVTAATAAAMATLLLLELR